MIIDSKTIQELRRHGGFRTVVADAAWKFDDKLPGGGRGAAKHYRTMSLDEIMAFRLPPLAPRARLFFWRVSSMQQEALDVIKAWGFKLKSELVWVKLWPNTGRLYMGMGHQVRNAHETCLIATRGAPNLERLDAKQRSVFFSRKPERHSQKPDRFYSIVQRLSPGPYVELFSRAPRPGWTCFGDEVDGAVPYGDQLDQLESLIQG